MKTGSLKFDGITVGELTANFLQGAGAISLKAKIAFVNSKTGSTHGWTTHDQWSPEVIAKLRELAELMEEDVAKVQFSDGTHAPRRGPAGAGLSDGLGEFLSDPAEAPQV